MIVWKIKIIALVALAFKHATSVKLDITMDITVSIKHNFKLACRAPKNILILVFLVIVIVVFNVIHNSKLYHWLMVHAITVRFFMMDLLLAQIKVRLLAKMAIFLLKIKLIKLQYAKDVVLIWIIVCHAMIAKLVLNVQTVIFLYLMMESAHVWVVKMQLLIVQVKNVNVTLL